MPSFNFCGTLNNYKPEEVAHLKNGRSEVKYFLAGFELAPSTGTPHLQIYFQLSRRVKITTMHNWPGWERISKIQPCVGSDEDNYVYCTKSTNFFEFGTREAHKGRGNRTDLDDLKDDIAKGMTYDEICEAHFQHAIKYHVFIKERIQALAASTVRGALKQGYEGCSLRPWQQEIMDIAQGEIHPRTVHWFWEREGNVGKTWITKYLAVQEDVQFMDGGKKGDLAHVYSKSRARTVVFNLSRTIQKDVGYDPMDGVYAFVENLKDGMIYSPKFDSGTFLTMGSNVIIFANFAPDQRKLSRDRWNIREI